MTSRLPNLHTEPWQILYLFKIGTTSWPVHCMAVTLVYLAMPHKNDAFLLWYSAILSLSVVMLALCYFCVQLSEAKDNRQIQICGIAHTTLTALIAIIWGLGALLATKYSQEANLFYALAMGGTMLGVVSSQSAMLRSCIGSIWFSMPWLVYAQWKFMPPSIGPISAALIFLFGATLTILAFRMHGFLNNNHLLTLDLREKVHALERTSKQLEIARQEAADANASKSRFLAHASHDLRQPLHAIGLLNSNLQHEEMSDFARETVGKIGTSVTNMSGLFRSLLDFSALELGKIKPQVSQFNLHDLMQDIASTNQEEANIADCDIQISVLDIWVKTDRTLLANILQNLMSNAIKYAPGRPIIMGAEVTGSTAKIYVTDNGKGIPNEDVNAVFTEYFRSSSGKPQKVDGLGLGLALVQRYAEIMGLTCILQSDEGNGTHVEIQGLMLAETTSAPRIRKPQSHQRLQGLKVHIVDDEPEILDATVKLFAKWGCVTTSSVTVPEGKLGIDLLISDFDLGHGVTGLDCINAVREFEGRNIPAMIVTGMQNLSLDELDLSEPIGLLEKPATAQKIRSLILSLLTRERRLNTSDHKPASRP